MIQNKKKNLAELNPTLLFSVFLSVLSFPLPVGSSSASALPPCMFWSVSLYPRVLFLSWPHALSAFALPLSLPIELTSAKEVMFSVEFVVCLSCCQ